MSGVSYERSRRRATDAIGDGLIPPLGRVLLCATPPDDLPVQRAQVDLPATWTAATAPHVVTVRDSADHAVAPTRRTREFVL